MLVSFRCNSEGFGHGHRLLVGLRCDFNRDRARQLTSVVAFQALAIDGAQHEDLDGTDRRCCCCRGYVRQPRHLVGTLLNGTEGVGWLLKGIGRQHTLSGAGRQMMHVTPGASGGPVSTGHP